MRYTGPKHRLARREGINILDKASASLQRRLNIPPGVHGKKRKRSLSEFGQQLREKQRAKTTYGLLEKQLKRLVLEVQKQKGETGELLISLLEARLDNLVYRLGFAKSRFQARQFVSHGHIFVNNKKITIPSYRVKEKDKILLSEDIRKNPSVLELIEEKPTILAFLKRQEFSGQLIRVPKKDDLDIPFDTQLIVEYYSR